MRIPIATVIVGVLRIVSVLGLLPDLRAIERDSCKVPTEGLVVDVIPLTTKRDMSAMKSVHASKMLRNATLSFALHAMLGQRFHRCFPFYRIAKLSHVGVRSS